jgi:hypothetical protein
MKAAISFGGSGNNKTEEENATGIIFPTMISFRFLYIVSCPLSIFLFTCDLFNDAVSSDYSAKKSHEINLSYHVTVNSYLFVCIFA